jgi:hypothetical protein
LLVSGFGLLAPDLILTIWRARPLSGPARFVLAGLAPLGATAALGTSFAWGLAGLRQRAARRPAWRQHSVARDRGARRLADTDNDGRKLSPDVDPRRSRATLYASAGTLGLALAGGLAAIAVQARLEGVLSLAGVSCVATVALYGRDVVALYRNRKRRTLELNTTMALYALGGLAGLVPDLRLH